MEVIKEVVLTREFNAPRDLVFEAWIDPDHVIKWWAPNGVTNEINSWYAKPGGKIDLVMVAGVDLGPLVGQRWPMTGEFKEINKPESLSFTANAVLDGKEILQHLTTVTFEEENGKTKMTVNIKVIKAVMPEAQGSFAGMDQGWNQQLDKLAAFLAKK